jgi:hypothetical protein
MNREAVIQMPTMGQLGGDGTAQTPPFVRMPFFPTAPYYSTRPNVGYQGRFYGATVLSTDADYTVGNESIRIVQFDIPCTMIAINASAIDTVVPANLSGINPLNTFLFRMEYSTGDQLMTAARLASTCLGTMENPGEIGGTGYVINPGASLVLGVTPLLANLRIDITLHCLEARGPSNYTMGR